MESLRIELPGGGYPIHLGQGLLARGDRLGSALGSAKAAIVTDETVAALYLSALTSRLRESGVDVVEIVLPVGEKHKDWPTLNLIFDELLSHRCERSTTLIALGGGVVGDMTGFAAACYQRGAPFIQVPTTLLAQVDSSIGGKTAINHRLGKNMIGAFYQPKLVLIDTEVLRSLPERELRAGLAEVAKYGLIRDLPFLEWLEANADSLLARDSRALEYAILRSCRNKAEVVAADEREHGERALLNMGHTFGHAIEAGAGYGQWLHGEAVAAGTVMAAHLSCRLGRLGSADVARVERLLRRFGLPLKAPALGVERYFELMQHDKKVQDGRLRLILFESIGRAVICDEAPPALIAETLLACTELEHA